MQRNGDNIVRRLGQRLLIAVMLLTANLGLAQGDRFPSKPIQLISTATAGSQSDTLLRFLGTEASKTLGQQIVIMINASAAGTIGAEQAKRAPADGYTLFVGGNTTMAANVHLVKNLNYDPLRDFEPITLITGNPLVLVVRADLPITSVPELIAYAKVRPGQMNYGVGNSGNKVAVGLLQSLTGISTTEIPYKGASQAMLELVAGRVDFMFSDPLVADPFIKDGKIRALAVTGPVPLASMRALPTVAKAGVPDYRELTTFLGLYAPRGTPKAVIDTLNSAFVKAINSKEGQDQYERMGLVPKTSTPQALGAFNKEQIAFWEHLVKVSGLQPE
jgi:tripartite-type tricarboxylate transporter receptor subunit TctC